MAAKRQGPLDWRVAIVDTQGKPTPEFMRKWVEQVSINAGIPTDAASMSKLLDLLGFAKGDFLVRDTTLWTPFAPGTDGKILRTKGAGNLPEWDTLSTILDLIGNTRSAILFRGASGWQILAPDSGKYLQSGGMASDPSWQTISVNIQTLLDGISSTQGTVLYRSATAWTALAPGTAGYVLTTGGAGANPAWAAGGGGGGGGYPPGTPPTFVQVAFSVSGGNSAVFGSAPTNGNLLVAMCFNPSNDAPGSGWTKQTEQSSGTDYGLVFTKVAGAGESTTQTPISGVGGTGGMVIWELHGQASSGFYVAGVSQVQQSGAANNTPLLFPNVVNCIGLTCVALVSGQTITGAFNLGTQDVLDNSGTRCLAAGHTDLSSTPMVGVMANFNASGSSKGCTCLITS